VGSILLLLLAPAAFGGITVSLPASGYCRLGKYMPVKVDASLQVPEVNPDSTDAYSQMIWLRSQGAVSTGILLSRGQASAVAPFLVLDSRASNIDWSAPDGSHGQLAAALHVLDDGQRLVGFATADRDIAQRLFPGKSIIPLTLDPAQPLPGAQAAWEVLDAIVLDASSASRLHSDDLATLIASGVTVAIDAPSPPLVRSDPMPSHPSTSALASAHIRQWPWAHWGKWWVLQPHLVGPATAVYDAEIAAPARGLHLEWSWTFRRLILLFAALYAIAVLAVLWWRPRYTLTAAALLTALTLALLSYWWHWQSPIVQVAGQIMIIGPDLTQTDDWAFQVSAQPIGSDVRWVNVIKPMFANREQAERSFPEIICFANGVPRELHYELLPAQPMTFLCRSIGPGRPAATPMLPLTSPLEQTARHFYLGPDDTILGQLHTAPIISFGYQSDHQWPGLIIDRKAALTGMRASAP
jgi:hypothetical protein